MSADTYSRSFFAGQRDASLLAAQKVLPVVFSLIPCRSMLDVGCGVGPWVASALELGVVDTLGIDGNYVNRSLLLIPEDLFRSSDLRKSFDLRRKFDLVICMEVAEHLDPEFADLIVDNLIRHGDAILFSAAIPGQGGTKHLNEQWPEYWQEKFARRRYRPFDVVRSRIWNIRQIPVWYRQNTYLFVSESKVALYPELLREPHDPKPVACVHPELFSEVLKRPLGLRRVLKELPMALMQTFRVRFSRLMD